MWNGAADALKPMPAMIIARPSTSSASPERLCCPTACAISSKPMRPRRAVHERRAEEQRRRAERADDQVLQPGLERALAVVVDRAHDVERDREPLEREEQRHQVRRADEERHAGERTRAGARRTRRRGRRAGRAARAVPTPECARPRGARCRGRCRRGSPARARSSGRGRRRRRRRGVRSRCRRRARST